MNANQSGKPKKRTIFRPEVARRYAQGQSTAVLPRLIAPSTFALLWVLLGTFGIGLLIAGLVEIPIFVQGTAVVLSDSSGNPDDLLLVAFLPAGNLPNLAAGQTIHWQHPITGSQVAQPVTAVSPSMLSPAKIRQTYPEAVGSSLSQPAIVMTATLKTADFGSNPASYLGTVVPVNVQVDSQRLLSLLPFLGERNVASAE